jgi:hypothetical protein
MTVFGLMWFGANAMGHAPLSQWDDEMFYYRTGIAINWWKKGVGKSN